MSELAIAQKAAMSGNLKALNDTERWQYYLAMCEHLELDPVSRPFDWIEKDNRLSLYPNANCAAQLAGKMLLSFPDYRAEVVGEVYVYRVKVTDGDARELWATGAVPIGKTAQETAQAFKKAETQARRRAVLAIGGLALTDADDVYESGGYSISPIVSAEPSPVGGEGSTEKPKRVRKALPEKTTEKPAEQLSDGAKAEARRIAWGWMRKLYVNADDALLIWKALDGMLDSIEEFLKIFPQKVPLVVGADDALKLFAAHGHNSEAALPHITEYGKQVAAAIAGPQPAPMPEPPPPPEPAKPTLPAAIIETFNVYEIPESERFPIWGFFSGVTLDDGGPFQATEDFLMFRTSKDIPKNIGLTDLLSIWRDTDGHLRKAKQAVGELVACKSDGNAASWHGGITKANRDLSADPVGFDSTPVWKWIKSIPLDGTKENRDRIHAIMSARGSDWGGVVADIKREFSA